MPTHDGAKSSLSQRFQEISIARRSEQRAVAAGARFKSVMAKRQGAAKPNAKDVQSVVRQRRRTEAQKVVNAATAKTHSKGKHKIVRSSVKKATTSAGATGRTAPKARVQKRRSEKSRPKPVTKREPDSKESLDAQLSSYMMKDGQTAKSSLDYDLDAYMTTNEPAEPSDKPTN
ncbi:hypothetical protein H4R34_002057 [Dimargaris verticillata]|uniref:Chromatin target of PRMT1 protein C-terminal domain-containing protein n=1 Tax=Dimargaris verticillata TaxID=2761393 RepID=A0A9W8B2H8_9FUNG|nr:hypothetical protein H4R34_002057 [Dimargaris verticillata]